VIIPDRVVDGLNLVWHSDLVISGGGTMNREAAALAVPVYSIFRGTIGAVDRYLANSGRLVLLQSVDDVRTKLVVRRRDRSVDKEITGRGTLDSIVDQITALTDSKCTGIQTTKLS
jgi:predicted glycosyltransferase